jgi:hypothetical protein
MTPKEKANELVDKFYQRFPLTMNVITTRGDLSWEYDSWNEAKQCALIAVDEIIEAGKDVDEFANAYWYKVKAEIDNL